MIQIEENTNLECLLWIFCTEMELMGIHIRNHYSKPYSLEIKNGAALCTDRCVKQSLCITLSYCYNKTFVEKNDVISSISTPYTKPTLEKNDIVLKIYNKWNHYKLIPSLTI
jgi:hypothetical protein